MTAIPMRAPTPRQRFGIYESNDHCIIPLVDEADVLALVECGCIALSNGTPLWVLPSPADDLPAIDDVLDMEDAMAAEDTYEQNELRVWGPHEDSELDESYPGDHPDEAEE